MATSVQRSDCSPRLKLIRRDFSYLIQEIAELFHLHPNAVRRWIRDGLRTIDDRKPHLVHGSDLIDYLGRRQNGRKRGCAPGEMYCCRCRAARRPADNKVTVEQVSAWQIMVRATCELCGTRMNQGGLLQRLPDVERVFKVTARSLRLSESADPLVMCHLPKDSRDAALQSQE